MVFLHFGHDKDRYKFKLNRQLQSSEHEPHPKGLHPFGTPIYLEDLGLRVSIPGYGARFVQSENMTIAFWEIKTGSWISFIPGVKNTGNKSFNP
jgi:hypothetical protein